uniref:Eukaryotic translation initiation factor 4E family member 2 related sequence 1 n=1 Tax=Gasterosteus aculeatus aculeatus TaxID=481459 RepID=A0AAQ4P6R7_GASAC
MNKTSGRLAAWHRYAHTTFFKCKYDFDIHINTSLLTLCGFLCVCVQVEQFWRFYSHLVRPGDLSGHSDFHLFKEGIKPMWEDDYNRSGGKWIIRLRKGLASRFWENIILAMLGEQFMVGEEICGAVVSIRFQEDILSIWNKTSNDQITTSRIRDTLRRVLNLPANTIMEYKTHNDKCICLGLLNSARPC